MLHKCYQRSLQSRSVPAVVLMGLALVISAGCKSQDTPALLREQSPAEPDPPIMASPAMPYESAEPTVLPRPWPGRVLYYENTDVSHLALYMQDPFEYWGSNDGVYRTWCLDDAIVGLASPAIFVGNLITLPVTAAMAPPWQSQGSRSFYPPQEPEFHLPGRPSFMAHRDFMGRTRSLPPENRLVTTDAP